MFFLLCRHNDDCVFDDFPKISDHFPKILQHLSKGHPNIAEHFPEISKITEDLTRRCFDDPPTICKVDISEIIDIFTTEDTSDESRMWFHINFTSGVLCSKTSVS